MLPPDPAPPPTCSGTADEPTTTRRGALARPIAVTLGGLALALAARRVPFPFVDDGAFRAAVGSTGARGYGLFSLGVAPFLSAAVLVELAALAIPRLRPLRNGPPAARAALVRATWIVAAALALLQGWGIATFLRSLLDARGGRPFAELPVAALALSLAAASLLATLFATKLGEHGLGNGFAVLLAGSVLLELLVSSVAISRVYGEVPIVWIASLAALGSLTVWLLRRRTGTGPRVPFPTSGVVPLNAAASLVALPAVLAAWFPALGPLAEAARRGSTAHGVVQAGAALGLAIVLARLFCPPDRVTAGWDRAGLAEPPPPGDVRAALARGHRQSAAFVLGLAIVPALLGIELGGVLAVVLVAAVGLDLADEVRARAAGPASVPAWALHRAWAVEPVLAALSAAGISAWARTRHFRALFHFFAPYAPVEVLVPAGRAAEAAAICARVASDPGTDPPR